MTTVGMIGQDLVLLTDPYVMLGVVQTCALEIKAALELEEYKEFTILVQHEHLLLKLKNKAGIVKAFVKFMVENNPLPGYFQAMNIDKLEEIPLSLELMQKYRDYLLEEEPQLRRMYPGTFEIMWTWDCIQYRQQYSM